MERRLRSRARLLRRVIGHPPVRTGPGSPRWPATPTAATVLEARVVHLQLGPIRSRAALLDSFSREGGVVGMTVTGPPADDSQGPGELDGISALELAYAARWIELSGGDALDLSRLLGGWSS